MVSVGPPLIAAGIALALACTAAPSPLLAQSQGAPSTVEGIEIIGHKPPPNDLQAPVPINVVTAESIALTGSTTLEQLLQSIP